MIAIPFVVRILVPVLRSIDDRLREAATVLGASPSRVWKEVDLPIVRRALLVAAGFAFAISLGEFGATLFIAVPDRPTMPVAIFRYLSQAGAANFGAAMAMSTVLMVITAVAIFTIERFRTPAWASFEHPRHHRSAGVVRRHGCCRRCRSPHRVGRDRHAARTEWLREEHHAAGHRRSVAPDRGRIALDGEDLGGVPPHRRRLGLMFQDYALLPAS